MKELIKKILPDKVFIKKNWPEILLVVGGFGGVFCVLVFAIIVIVTITSLHL
jgi:hypothetical protein